jgi:hypothetical protein
VDKAYIHYIWSELRNAYRISVGKLKTRDSLRDVGVDMRILEFLTEFGSRKRYGLVHDKIRKRNLMNKKINLWVL